MIKIYVDGSQINEGKNRKIGIGLYGEDDDKKIIEISKYKNIGLIHQAEHYAVLEALKIINKYNLKDVFLYSDNEVLMKNMNDNFGGMGKKTLPLFKEIAMEYGKCESKITFSYIKSEDNKAHKYAYRAAKGHNQTSINISEIKEKEPELDIAEKQVTNHIENNNLEANPTEKYMMQYLESKNNEILATQKKMNKLIAEQQSINKMFTDYMEMKKNYTILKNENSALLEQNNIEKNNNKLLREIVTELVDVNKQINKNNNDIINLNMCYK